LLNRSIRNSRFKLFSNAYKTLPSLTNLYRTPRGPVLKSTYCVGINSLRIEEHPMNREKVTSTFARLILVVVTMSGMLALCTQTATAQAIIVTTPFAFSAGNQSYPAGTYQFTLLSEWSLSIRNVNGGGEKYFMVRPEEKGSLGSHGSLTFRNSEGHRNLQAVYVPGTDIAAELFQHNARSNSAKSDTSLVSTVSSEKLTTEKQNATGR
jgi:hypothetical protein